MVVRGGSIINLAGTTPIDDPEYRYKMPAVFGKIEGSGNGIKTVIPNITDVGNSLHRAPGEVNKFFGTELGAQTRYSAETDRAIVNGAHTDDTLQNLVRRYIDKFVLCPNCNLPETEYKIKNDTIFHKCKACGAKELVDMSHRLCNFILAENKKAKKDGKGKNKKVCLRELSLHYIEIHFVGSHSFVLFLRCAFCRRTRKPRRKIKKEATRTRKPRRRKRKPRKRKKRTVTVSHIENVFQTPSFQCTALLTKYFSAENGDKNYLKEAMFGKKEDDVFGDDDDDDDDDSVSTEAGVDDSGARKLAVEAVRKLLDENPDISTADLVEAVTNQQMASALKSQDKVYILVSAAITPNFFKKKDVSKYAPAVSKITNGNRIMERHLIASLESLCIDKPKNFPVLIKQFYDEDVLTEDIILEWAESGRTEYTYDVVDEETRALLRGEAEPVVVWLQEADSEDDSDDDDSEE